MGNISSATVLLYVAITAFVFRRVIFKQLRGSTLSGRTLWLMPVVLLVISWKDADAEAIAWARTPRRMASPLWTPSCSSGSRGFYQAGIAD
ncbi:MAG: hypothetical protein QOI21_5550 [Actinomycetota bacterium]|nr:hypothetical protein [Actinomycetota bacterium]